MSASRSPFHLATSSRLSRRSVLGLGLGLAGAAGLAACGAQGGSSSGSASSSAATESATLKFLNFPDWIGKDEYAAFAAATPGVTVVETALAEGGVSAISAQIAQNKGAFDFAVLGEMTAAQLKAGGLLAEFDPALVPDLTKIPQNFRDIFPYGLPTDLGKVGIGYRADLVNSPPTSWKQLFEMIPRYSGQVIFPNYDADVLAVALLALGHDVNSDNESELNAAKDLIVSVKPHLKAFLSTDQGAGLADKSSAMAVFYDYSYASVAPEDATIKWSAPSEGLPAYVDGWAPLAGTQHMPQLAKFMQFHLQPKVYAGFINATSAAYLLPDAEPYLDAAIKNDPALKYDASQDLKFYEFKGAEAVKLRSQIWEEIKAA
jgi:spermidine/putrescine-binding protein